MHMAEVTIGYGMTETSPVSTQTRADDDLERASAPSAGCTRTSRSRSSTRSPARRVPRGETGEFCTRGYSVMLGYWDDPEKTAEAIDATAGCTPATSRVMDDDGYVNIVGRIKDMVIRGGENVYPREIEEFLYTHPDIEDVQVIGVPDEKYGEELWPGSGCATAPTPLDAEAVRAFCTRQARALQDPALRAVVDEFPMTVTGKIRKVEMREETAASSAWPDAPGRGFKACGRRRRRSGQ